ncbi:hypothetical protein OGAPHI_004828 [Ogataea philodendri]|uniref:Uncharacterized protein n=1 Tax=Ogataea philodendri TaxID=1378263 RepID=A0A9P8T3E8_9ASCO|nr:uncharacterized protein OGAPHI_004828 [Ogataea philodendri]KAH3664114.1 hypothetical protein OGAPHI_004828 [Ogataea philodendri]
MMCRAFSLRQAWNITLNKRNKALVSCSHLLYKGTYRTDNYLFSTSIIIYQLFKLLLWSQLVGVTALSLSAVGGSWWESSVTLSANGLLTVVFGSQSLEGWLNDTTSQSKHQVQCGLLLDVVVRKSSAVLKLFTGENQSLLVRRNSFLVLDLGLDVVDGVGRLHLQGDGLSGQSLDENLHFDLTVSLLDQKWWNVLMN